MGCVTSEALGGLHGRLGLAPQRHSRPGLESQNPKGPCLEFQRTHMALGLPGLVFLKKIKF